MRLNGIDFARADALTAAGIDPDGPMSQYGDVLGATYVYCNQHHNVHRVDGSCTVDAFEKFPLYVDGDFDAALAHARTQGFVIYGEPTECRHCHQPITSPDGRWVSVDSNDSRCPDRTPTAYGSGHEPVAHIPANRVANV